MSTERRVVLSRLPTEELRKRRAALEHHREHCCAESRDCPASAEIAAINMVLTQRMTDAVYGRAWLEPDPRAFVRITGI